MSRWTWIIALLLLAGSSFAPAQTPDKPTLKPVAFDCQCSDPVGAAYEKDLRQMLAADPAFSLQTSAVATDKKGKVVAKNWHISVMSIDPSPGDLGHYAALSIVFLRGNDEFLLQDVQYCSLSMTHGCAQSTLTTFAQLLREIGQ